MPQLVVGDLDSISSETLLRLKNDNVDIREFPVDKDKTDLELAISEAIASGATEITLTGVLGGRVDHILANIFLLRATLAQRANCCIREEAVELHLIDRHLTIAGMPGDIVSLIALEDCAGVVLSNFEYQVPNGKLISGSTLGVSNVLLGKQGTIELESGLLVVVISRTPQ